MRLEEAIFFKLVCPPTSHAHSKLKKNNTDYSPFFRDQLKGAVLIFLLAVSRQDIYAVYTPMKLGGFIGQGSWEQHD